MYRDVGIADQQKHRSKVQNKLFTTQPHPTYLSKFDKDM